MTTVQESPLTDYHALLVGKGRVLVVGPKTAELWSQGPTPGERPQPSSKPRYEFAAIAWQTGACW
jgi:hypothetical protein